MSGQRRTPVFASIALAALTMSGCTATTPESAGPVPTSFATGVLVAEQDAGSITDQHAVRQSVVAALTDQNRAFVIDRGLRGTTPATVLQTITAARPTRERVALLSRARTPELTAELESSFSFYVHQEFGPGWSGSGSRSEWLDRDVWASSAFHVDQWQGVRVTGDVARVLVRGEDRGSSWAGLPKRDSWAQYKLILRRDRTAPNGWRITQQQAASTAA